MSHAPALLALLVTTLLLPAATASAPPEREIIVHVFRAPSIGMEVRQGLFGVHVGAYPTVIDRDGDGAHRTTWFVKAGVSAYVLGLAAGSTRTSNLYVGLALMRGLHQGWGWAGFVDAGFRWAAWQGLDLRLGAGLLVERDGRVRLNPTPGASWTFAY
jgi:hypothetical protein